MGGQSQNKEIRVKFRERAPFIRPTNSLLAPGRCQALGEAHSCRQNNFPSLPRVWSLKHQLLTHCPRSLIKCIFSGLCPQSLKQTIPGGGPGLCISKKGAPAILMQTELVNKKTRLRETVEWWEIEGMPGISQRCQGPRI